MKFKLIPKPMIHKIGKIDKFELCPEKMYLKIFVLVISKEGLAGGANPSFGMTRI